MIKNGLKLSASGLVAFVLVLITFAVFDLPSSRGFNPSDDGMVIAQSYRILNGEIPHIDFMSLRPVLSGYIHVIDFYLPFSLIENGRIMMMFGLFLAALVWSYMLAGFVSIGINSKSVLFFASTIITFVLNLNTFMPYPWTTTDGTALAGIGASLVIIALNQDGNKIFSRYLSWIAGLWMLSMSALCKQNFAVLPFVAIVILYADNRRLLKTILVSFVGILPILAYIVYLSMHGGLYDLLAQMGGRKALAGPGIMSYLVHFYNARLFVVNVLILIVALVMRYRLLPVETIRSETFKVHGLLTLSYGAIIVLGAVILLGNQDYHAVPFEIFFILSIYSVWTFLNSPISVRELSVSFFALAISWSASISGGMNSPLLGTGYLATAFFATAYFSFRTTESAKMQYTKYGGIIKIIPVAFSIVLLLFSAYGQRKFNYRDKPATALGSHLGEISHEKFGSIRTNRTTYEYLLSVKEVLEEHPEMKDRSVFLPNHCALYPVFNTRNPFPLEWNDRWEYLGLESDYHKRCRLALAKDPVYLFVDKINAEKMADSLTDMHYDEWLHENIVSFLKLSEKMDIKNNFFDVHVMTQ